jgi:hypothetical protein
MQVTELMWELQHKFHPTCQVASWPRRMHTHTSRNFLAQKSSWGLWTFGFKNVPVMKPMPACFIKHRNHASIYHRYEKWQFQHQSLNMLLRIVRVAEHVEVTGDDLPRSPFRPSSKFGTPKRAWRADRVWRSPMPIYTVNDKFLWLTDKRRDFASV